MSIRILNLNNCASKQNLNFNVKMIFTSHRFLDIIYYECVMGELLRKLTLCQSLVANLQSGKQDAQEWIDKTNNTIEQIKTNIKNAQIELTALGMSSDEIRTSKFYRQSAKQTFTTEQLLSQELCIKPYHDVLNGFVGCDLQESKPSFAHKCICRYGKIKFSTNKYVREIGDYYDINVGKYVQDDCVAEDEFETAEVYFDDFNFYVNGKDCSKGWRNYLRSVMEERYLARYNSRLKYFIKEKQDWEIKSIINETEYANGAKI